MPTTVVSVTPNNNGAGNAGWSYRQFFLPSGGGLGQVRVTFIASASGNLQTDHCSIAVKGSATTPNVQSTPTELLFSGASGFNIAASGSITSDWLTFAFTSSDTLCVTMDMSSTVAGYTGNLLYVFDNTYSEESWGKAADASYNVATVSGYSNAGSYDRTVSLIETQAAAGASVPFTRPTYQDAQVDAPPTLPRNLPPSITNVPVNNPPPGNKFATALLAALTAWAPVDNLPILPVKRVPPTVIVSAYLPKRPALDNSAWNPSDPQPIVARNLAPQLTAVRVDQPPIPTPENFWNGYASWIPGDPQPPVGPKGVFPGAAAVAGVPFSRASSSTILASWTPPDGPPTLAGKLSAQTLAVRVDNPPGRSGLTDYSAWQASDANPTMPRYAPQQPVVVVSFNPSTRSWLTSVISAWQPDDPLPTLPAKLLAGLSVDNPPRLVRQAWFAAPDDPLPTIGARFVKFTPAIVNNPPFAQPPQFAVIANSWVAPDPQPTLTKKLPSALAAVAVNQPPRKLQTLPAGVFDAWAPIDPLPALRARGTFGNVVFGVAGQQRWSLATVRTIASTAKRLSYYPASVRTLQVMNMPYVGTDFSIADPGALEQDIYRFNATPRLASDGSETLTGPGTWVVAVVSGVDASPMTRIIGSPTLLNGVVSQMIGNLVAGVKYLIQVTVTTSTGRVLTAYSHVTCTAPT